MPSKLANDNNLSPPAIAIIGAGPAGLMAAEVIAKAGYSVDVFDAMPSVARKFLLAGVGGMNITHAEDYGRFISRYGDAKTALKPLLDDFGPEALRDWIHQLGIDTFIGSSKRVFPSDMKAAPLLRAWLHRLRQQGVRFHPRHRWLGWRKTANTAITPNERQWLFETPTGEQDQCFDAVVLALGGASWSKLGSDGRWFKPLQEADIKLQALQPSNCGFEVAWSPFIKNRYPGTPIKDISLSLTDKNGTQWSKKGEFVISEYGIEGSLVYALSAPLRDSLATQPTTLWLDWLPNSSLEQVQQKLQQSPKNSSFTTVLRKKLHLPAIAAALLKDYFPELNYRDHSAVAIALKAMPLNPTKPRPIDEVISSAGGVSFDAVDQSLMLKQLKGVFVAGEMLDWEAPTGGYLLTGCFTTGRAAGLGVIDWLQAN